MKKTVKRIMTVAMAIAIMFTAFAPVEAQAASKKSAYPVVTSGSVKVTKKSAKTYTMQVTAGKKAKLTVKVSGKNVTKKAKYTSSKKTVATVSKTGVVTAKKAGTAKIKVTYKGKVSTVTVKVVKKAAAKPATCTHNWKAVYRTESTGEEVIVCKCGEKFANTTAHNDHVLDRMLNHGEKDSDHSWHADIKTTQVYDHSVCTKCGAVK